MHIKNIKRSSRVKREGVVLKPRPLYFCMQMLMMHKNSFDCFLRESTTKSNRARIQKTTLERVHLEKKDF